MEKSRRKNKRKIENWKQPYWFTFLLFIWRTRSHPPPYFPHQSLKILTHFLTFSFRRRHSSSHTTLPTPRLDIHTQPTNSFKGISKKTRGLCSSEIGFFSSSPEKPLTRDCIFFFHVGIRRVYFFFLLSVLVYLSQFLSVCDLISIDWVLGLSAFAYWTESSSSEIGRGLKCRFEVIYCVNWFCILRLIRH